ncbi:SMI1/KNR4 family protein [Grimontia marina]|uniref:Uncharacterized protein n=1 Tax=Grimontia marina TaxID=646534 RepID=A0A128F745_9GAMM|nr:SMI1/KNR4 family protein [Grimontia marina]CZF82325.1 hypothetical protein GMA8713_02179 [Grimontia marina]
MKGLFGRLLQALAKTRAGSYVKEIEIAPEKKMASMGEFTDSERAELAAQGVVFYRNKAIFRAREPITVAEIDAVESACGQPIPRSVLKLWQQCFGGEHEYNLLADFSGFVETLGLNNICAPKDNGYKDLYGWIENEWQNSDGDSIPSLPVMAGQDYIERLFVDFKNNETASAFHCGIAGWEYRVPNADFFDFKDGLSSVFDHLFLYPSYSPDESNRLVYEIPSTLIEYRRKNGWTDSDPPDGLDDAVLKTENPEIIAKFKMLQIANMLDWRGALEQGTIIKDWRLPILSIEAAILAEDIHLLNQLEAAGCDLSRPLQRNILPVEFALLNDKGTVFQVLRQRSFSSPRLARIALAKKSDAIIIEDIIKTSPSFDYKTLLEFLSMPVTDITLLNLLFDNLNKDWADSSDLSIQQIEHLIQVAERKIKLYQSDYDSVMSYKSVGGPGNPQLERFMAGLKEVITSAKPNWQADLKNKRIRDRPTSGYFALLEALVTDNVEIIEALTAQSVDCHKYRFVSSWAHNTTPLLYCALNDKPNAFKALLIGSHDLFDVLSSMISCGCNKYYIETLVNHLCSVGKEIPIDSVVHAASTGNLDIVQYLLTVFGQSRVNDELLDLAAIFNLHRYALANEEQNPELSTRITDWVTNWKGRLTYNSCFGTSAPAWTMLSGAICYDDNIESPREIWPLCWANLYSGPLLLGLYGELGFEYITRTQGFRSQFSFENPPEEAVKFRGLLSGFLVQELDFPDTSSFLNSFLEVVINCYWAHQKLALARLDDADRIAIDLQFSPEFRRTLNSLASTNFDYALEREQLADHTLTDSMIDLAHARMAYLANRLTHREYLLLCALWQPLVYIHFNTWIDIYESLKKSDLDTNYVDSILKVIETHCLSNPPLNRTEDGEEAGLWRDIEFKLPTRMPK